VIRATIRQSWLAGALLCWLMGWHLTDMRKDRWGAIYTAASCNNGGAIASFSGAQQASTAAVTFAILHGEALNTVGRRLIMVQFSFHWVLTLTRWRVTWNTASAYTKWRQRLNSSAYTALFMTEAWQGYFIDVLVSQSLHYKSPSPTIDNIWVLMVVWRLSEMYCDVLCTEVVHSHEHT